MATKLARRVSSTATPKFVHDCANCRFVGSLDGQDLYVCSTGTFLRRFGNEDHENGSLGDIAPEGSPYALIKTLVERKLPPAAYVTVTR